MAGNINVVQCQGGVLYIVITYLGEVFSRSSYFNDKILVYTEITCLDASVFDLVLRRVELVAEKGLAHCPDFRRRVGESVEQVAVVEQYLVGLLQVTDSIELGEKSTNERGFF